MRLIIQRTTQASVAVDDKITGEIGLGMLILAGIARLDTPGDAEYLAKKVHELRIFPDDRGKMNLDLRQAGGSILVIPNFTLYGDCSKGRRPGFDLAAPSDIARPLFDYLIEAFMNKGMRTQTGVFGAHMKVGLLNDGPITFVLDSPPR